MHRQYNLAAGPARPAARRIAIRRIALVTGLCASGASAIGYYYPESQTPPAPIVAAAVAEVAPATSAAPVDVVPLRPELRIDTQTSFQAALGNSVNVPPASEWKTVGVGAGQNLSQIFTALGLPADDWMSIMKLGGDATRLRHLRTGDTLNVRLDGDHLSELTYAFDETRTLNIRRGAKGFDAVTMTAAIEHRNVETAGTIEDSLFADGRKAKLSDRLILQVADIFDYDIDFAQDLQPGDRFSVVYDVLYKDGKKLRDGDIIAAEFTNNGQTYRAVRYQDSEGHVAYYTPDGQSTRKAFIRTPVDFARISSGFNLHRRHPILNVIRAHKGVDYAAPIGTPVKATGDGRIEFVGRKGGYGNLIVIKHWGPYETAYGHLLRFRSGIAVGSKVRQGQVIGYVGMSGLATGPHLHYEFRVDGIHKNPVTVALPHAMPIYGQELARFKSTTTPLLAQLDAVKSSRLAQTSTNIQKD